MSLYILDTDHLSLHQRNPHIFLSRLQQLTPDELAITVVTAEEQLRGRLAQIKKAASDTASIEAYRWLRTTIFWLGRYRILDFDEPASGIFKSLRQQKLRVGTQDLRIAAIALATGATLVTRNQRDFGQVIGLELADWTK